MGVGGVCSGFTVSPRLRVPCIARCDPTTRAGPPTALRSRQTDAAQDAYVFPTATGARIGDENFRSRVLGRPAVIVDGDEVKPAKGAVGRANANLEASGLPPLPDKLTPHSLRRTFASVLYALNVDAGTVADEMGHTDPALAFRVYRHAMRRDEGENAALRALVEGGELANIGQRSEKREAATVEAEAA